MRDREGDRSRIAATGLVSSIPVEKFDQAEVAIYKRRPWEQTPKAMR